MMLPSILLTGEKMVYCKFIGMFIDCKPVVESHLDKISTSYGKLHGATLIGL